MNNSAAAAKLKLGGGNFYPHLAAPKPLPKLKVHFWTWLLGK